MALQLCHVTVQTPSAVTASETCLFGANEEHLILARGQWLEVFKIEDDEPVLKCRANVFATLRCIHRVASQNGGPDTLAITSDSGVLVILAYDCDRARFSRLSSEPIGRSGLRRTVPGEYLSVDPKGRVIMVAAIEKCRSIYVLHSEGVSSAVEAPAPSTFCYSLVAMDRGYSNPAFVSLERFRFSHKTVSMYEFNLGLNHLIKLWSYPVADETDVVVPLPGGRDGPSGVIAFVGASAVYLDPSSGEARFNTGLPQPVVSAHTVCVRRGEFFVVAQTITGQVLKLSFNEPEGIFTHTVSCVLPRALEFQVLNSGYMFVNSEAGDHTVVQLESLDPLQLGESATLPSLSPCISSHLHRKQLATISRTDEKSRISLLDFGCEVEELVSTPLPGIPSAVYASKRSTADAGHRLIALAFEDATTFLSVADDGSVNEVSEADTGLASKVRTLGLECIGAEDALVQVHSSGFRFVVSTRITPWTVPKNAAVIGCAFTVTQMLLILDTKQVLYFESREGTLVESKQKVHLPSNATAVCFESPSGNEIRSLHFYVSCEDESVRMFSLPDLKQQKLYNAPAPVTSMLHKDTLHLGHVNGLYSAMHNNSFWTRALGNGPVRLVSLTGSNIMALTSRNWFISKGRACPLARSAPNFVAAHPFVAEDLSDGVLGISGSSLVVFAFPTVETGNKIIMNDLVSVPSPIVRMTRNSQFNFWYACGGETVYVVANRAEDPPLDPFSLSTGSTVVACSNVRFDSHKMEALVVVTKTGIQTYKYAGSPVGSEVALLHETRVSDCTAILPFKGMLLAAVDKTSVVIYDLGQKQLLRKAAIDLPDLRLVRALRASRDRIYVGDSSQSVTVLSYGQSGLYVVYQDPIPRSVTAMVILDYATICIGDQYGDIAVLRCPSESPNAGLTDGTVSALELIAHFKIADGIVDIHKGVLSPVAAVDAIIYTGLQGTIGALIPLQSKEDREFMLEVEFQANRRLKGLADRDNSTFRSYYTPAKNVVDGDLCEFVLSRQGLNKADVDDVAEALGIDATELFQRVYTFREWSVF